MPLMTNNSLRAALEVHGGTSYVIRGVGEDGILFQLFLFTT